MFSFSKIIFLWVKMQKAVQKAVPTQWFRSDPMCASQNVKQISLMNAGHKDLEFDSGCICKLLTQLFRACYILYFFWYQK